ncbi:MAG TPA: hypothetical protein VHM66_10440 [Solirubrobacterales bacterium]|nr:hypothetical protein [Solirubrobacterales bacterium]
MQINRIGIGLVVSFGVAGLALIVALISGEAGWILKPDGAIWLVVALGMTYFTRRQQDKAAHRDWVFQNGLKGAATVVKASSHATVNGLPLISLVLDLKMPGLEDRRVKRRLVMSVFAANRLEPGLVLPVDVNPEDPDDLVLLR